MDEPSPKARYMRERRASGGDALRAAENAARRERRSTAHGQDVRRAEYRRAWARDHQGASSDVSRFVGVDGEGGTGPDGRHVYLLLRAGNAVLETGQPLTWTDCFGFLADLDPTNIYVGYFFDYDATMMCAGLPQTKIKRLLNRQVRQRPGWATPLPVDLAGFDIDYLPGKFFKVRRAATLQSKATPWVEISDVGKMFQTSFVTTLRLWEIGTPAQRELIAAGKDARAEFSEIDDRIRLYNALEIELLEQLMERFRNVCRIVGVVPRKWQGPGDIATALLQRHRIPRKQELDCWNDEEFRSFVDQSYYGGRFETSAVGDIPGPVYAVDINSAYPFAMTKVPCLVHGWWEHTGRRPKGQLWVASVCVESRPGERPQFWGLPMRSAGGGVSFPGDIGNGTYWNFELHAAIHQRFSIQDSWSYHRECDCVPFGFIPDLYWRRQQMGKSAQGMVLKLGMNSLYGKTAQRIGSAPYNNFVWGSFITAHCRTMLQRHIHSLTSCKEGNCGSSVHMLATDGIYTSELPPGFEASDALGAWDCKTYDRGIFIVQPGLYFDNAGETTADRLAKTRGVPTNRALECEDAFRAAFLEVWQTGMPDAASVAVQLSNFWGMRIGMHRRRPDMIGQWQTEPRNITFDWRSKRRPDAMCIDDNGHRYLATFPPDGSVLDFSRPYDRELSRQLDANRHMAVGFGESPDWAEVLGAPDQLI